MNFDRLDENLYEYNLTDLKTYISNLKSIKLDFKRFLTDEEIDYLNKLLKNENEFLSKEEFDEVFQTEAKLLIKSRNQI